MAKSINVKEAPAPVAVVKTDQPKTLTVVVLDDKNIPTEGAKVSVMPGDLSNVTNSAGEVQFKLGNATKYDVTATYGSKTVTVPYYVTKDGATRLVVNPTYVRMIEKKLHPSLVSSEALPYIGIGLGVIIVLFVVWKFFLKKKRK